MTHRVFAALFIMTFLGFAAHSQEKTPDPTDVLQGYIDAARPVAEHARLKTLAGAWTATVRLWFDPGKPPMTGEGTATGRMILGDRFLQIDSSVGPPLPTESLTILGFDRRTNEYTMVAFDTLGTYSVTATGKYDAAREAVVLDGSYLQPPHGGLQKYRFVWKQESPHSQVIRLYFLTPDGSDVLVAESVYARGR